MNITKIMLASLFFTSLATGSSLAADEPATDDKAQQFAAAVKLCEEGPAADKQKCIDAAKKKFGQM